MKAYTDLEQSKKLAEFLPLESADGFWGYHDKWCSEGDEWEGYEDYPRAEPYLEYTREENEWKEDKSDVPCWSLAALLSVLPNGTRVLKSVTDDTYHCDCPKRTIDKWYDNPVDACMAMIENLHELKAL